MIFKICYVFALFEAGKDAVPKLSIVLRRMSLAVVESRSEIEQKKKQSKKCKKSAARSLAGAQSKIDTFFKKKSV